MMPAIGCGRPVGPLYEAKIIEFGERHWSLERAVTRSESLRRARAHLRALGGRWNAYVQGQR